jgi:hypothetical protein
VEYLAVYASSFADSEHLGSAYRTHALSCWLAILHGYGFGISHFSLSAALYAVGLHLFTSFPGYSLLAIKDKPFNPTMSIASVSEVARIQVFVAGDSTIRSMEMSISRICS